MTQDGLRYRATVWLLRDNALVEHVFLAGPVPYTVEVAAAELRGRGYDVRRVWVPTGPPTGGTFRAEIERHHHHEHYRVMIGRGDPSVWRGVILNGVLYRRDRGCWVMVHRRQSDDDDDWMLSISRDLAEAVMRSLGVELPPHERLTTIAGQAHERLRRHWARDEAWYTRRGERFAGPAARVAALTADRAALPPLPVLHDTYAATRAAEDTVRAVPVRLDEPFPLVRMLLGWSEHAQRLVNRVRLDTAAGPVTATLRVWPRPATLEYPTVTPFCPAEGYQPDPGDTAPHHREEKLRDDLWGHVQPKAFPISPCRLRIDLEHTAGLLPDIWLELAFDPATRWLGVPFARAGTVTYEEFVPADRPLPAEVPGWAPSWLSINVPPSVGLLKTVTATLRHLPGRPRPSPDSTEG